MAFAGNVTVATDLTVSGDTTLNGNVTLGNAATDIITVNGTVAGASAVVFEGGTADDFETTLAFVDPTADRTVYVPNQTGYLPVLDTASTTQITSTPEEINILDGATVTTAELNILDGVTATAAELNLMDDVTSTTAELNITDGSTTATNTTLEDADRVVVNDDGTMVQVALTDFETYFETALDTLTNVTTVSDLNSGSITSGFGSIDNGTDNITTGGILKVGADGTAINAAGSLTYGAGDDVGVYWDGDENYVAITTALTNAPVYNTLQHTTSGTPANGIGVGLQAEVETAASNNEKIGALVFEVTDVTATAEDAELNIRLMIAGAAHAETATFSLGGLNLVSSDEYSIDGNSVLNATTLGSGVTASSLTSVGVLASPVLTTPQINDTSADHQYVFAVSELTSDRTVTLPLLTGNDTFVFADFSQTLTSKTIDSDNNTIQNIVDADIKSTAEITVSKLADGAARQLLQTDAAGSGWNGRPTSTFPGHWMLQGIQPWTAYLTFTGRRPSPRRRTI